ncbi:hypothetical protein D3C76_1818570 [compost metagenome]
MRPSASTLWLMNEPLVEFVIFRFKIRVSSGLPTKRMTPGEPKACPAGTISTMLSVAFAGAFSGLS